MNTLVQTPSATRRSALPVALLVGIGSAFVVWGILLLLYGSAPEGSGMQRVLIMLGGTLPEGIIQLLTYLAFFWAMAEIVVRLRRVRYEREALGAQLLPEKEHWVIAPEEVAALRLKVVEAGEARPSLLTDLIRKAATKFRANHSVSEVMEVVSHQARLNLSRAESEQSLIRYLAWAIPSIGFVGTILGIAASLGLADQADSPEGLAAITAALSVAFDTTLVALLLSLVLMYFFHRLQEKEERLHGDIEEYVTEHFVNRLHPEEPWPAGK